MNKWAITLSACIGTSLWLSAAHAAEDNLFFSGILVSEPCVINNNKPVTASFGDVQTEKIDGVYKSITLDYSLNCDSETTNGLRMYVGGVTGFDSKALAIRNNDDIGIALIKDGTRLTLNNWFDFDPRKQPVLQAVLVKYSLFSKVNAGAFQTSATLAVDYQ
ncbi:fimbrial protein [Pseudomonas sp. B329]|uniref:fimbrial protein n=1 Tax=Pseudomonas sp. B329 TaxID=1553459 RepID=UPI002003330E|nr:fimbrial protein [Pseudomonas sp. B329]MCK3863862.1 fimbrial protein [Pseudomonas sp. B329]